MTLKDFKKKWKEEEARIREKTESNPLLIDKIVSYNIGWANCLDHIVRELTEAGL